MIHNPVTGDKAIYQQPVWKLCLCLCPHRPVGHRCHTHRLSGRCIPAQRCLQGVALSSDIPEESPPNTFRFREHTQTHNAQLDFQVLFQCIEQRQSLFRVHPFSLIVYGLAINWATKAEKPVHSSSTFVYRFRYSTIFENRWNLSGRKASCDFKFSAGPGRHKNTLIGQ
jgi:hypothetical protein